MAKYDEYAKEILMSDWKLPLDSQITYYVPLTGDGYDPNRKETREITDDLERANIISSEVKNWPGRHKVVLDLDVPAQLIPSTTPGHSHLYIDVSMSWHEYVNLLRVLVEVGIIEYGYACASIDREHTALRLPWIKKQEALKSGEV